MYYKAEIFISTEELELNSQGEYEGCNPDTFQDHGLCNTLKAQSLDELKQKIESEYFDLEKPIGASVMLFDGCIEIQYEGEHDYRTPKEERIPFIETARIIISEVKETTLDISNLTQFQNIEKY